MNANLELLAYAVLQDFANLGLQYTWENLIYGCITTVKYQIE